MEQKIAQQLMYILVADPVVIVQRQDEPFPGLQQTTVGQTVNLIGERCAQDRQRRQFSCLQKRLHLRAGRWEECANGGNQISQKGSQIAVALI
jgi:hypothetical protein